MFTVAKPAASVIEPLQQKQGHTPDQRHIVDMNDFLFIVGAPGSGKTTVARLLKVKLHAPYIDLDWLRSWHLRDDWGDASDGEREMALDNLLYLLRNYRRHGYRNVIVAGLLGDDVGRLLRELADARALVVTLYLRDDDELADRVLTESRDSGWRDIEASVRLNREWRDELSFPNEFKLDNTGVSPQITANRIMALLLH